MLPLQLTVTNVYISIYFSKPLFYFKKLKCFYLFQLLILTLPLVSLLWAQVKVKSESEKKRRERGRGGWAHGGRGCIGVRARQKNRRGTARIERAKERTRGGLCDDIIPHLHKSQSESWLVTGGRNRSRSRFSSFSMLSLSFARRVCARACADRQAPVHSLLPGDAHLFYRR